MSRGLIVVPLDGSAFAERALRPACAFAARGEGARVVLLSCTPDDPDAIGEYLADRAALYAAGVDIATRVLGGTPPVDGILSTLADEPDALLCMATHGRTAIVATVLGSVAKQVVCRAASPLVLVGPHCRTALLPTEHGRMLACSDGSTFSSIVLPAAGAWSGRLQLEPWLVEVVAPDESIEPRHGPHANREEEAAYHRLAELSTHFAAPISGTHTKVLHGTPSRSITWFAEQLPAGLIAMASHGRTGLTDVLLGSVATEVVRHAPCPVLLVRPSAATQTCLDDA